MPVKIDTRDLARALKDLDKKSRGKNLAHSVRVGAKVLEAEARRRAPVGKGETAGRTLKSLGNVGGGFLRDSMATRKSGKESTPSYSVYNVGPTAFYGGWVEFGVRNFKSKAGYPAENFAGKDNDDLPARPYLRPAIEAKHNAAVDAFVVRLRKRMGL